MGKRKSLIGLAVFIIIVVTGMAAKYGLEYYRLATHTDPNPEIVPWQVYSDDVSRYKKFFIEDMSTL